MLIIFNTNFSDTTGQQVIVQFFTAPIVCFRTAWGNEIDETFNEVGNKTII